MHDKHVGPQVLTTLIGPGHAKTAYAICEYQRRRSACASVQSDKHICCLDSMICILALSNVSRFLLASVAEQAGLNLVWSKIPEDMFLCDVAQIQPSPRIEVRILRSHQLMKNISLV